MRIGAALVLLEPLAPLLPPLDVLPPPQPATTAASTRAVSATTAVLRTMRLTPCVRYPELHIDPAPLRPSRTKFCSHASRYAILHAVMAAEQRQAPNPQDPIPLHRSGAAYDRVRAGIVHGVLRPNQRLIEVELAAQLGVSRTPVREALQRLLLEGLVRRERGGWAVHEHSPEEIQAIYEVRAALEGYAAFLAAGRASAEEVAALGAIYPPGDAALELGPDEQVELNERFHDGVIAAAANSRLSQLSRASRQYYFNHRIARRYDGEETRRSIDGHRRILAALAQGDGPAAEAHAREHVDYALAIVLEKVT